MATNMKRQYNGFDVDSSKPHIVTLFVLEKCQDLEE